MLGVYDADVARIAGFELPVEITSAKSVVLGGKRFMLSSTRNWLAFHNGVERKAVSYLDCLQVVKNKCKDFYGMKAWNSFLASYGMEELIEG